MTTQIDYLRCTHTFKGRSVDELDITLGDYIEVIEDDSMFNDTWYRGRNIRTYATGLFPNTFTTPVSTLPPDVAKLAAEAPPLTMLMSSEPLLEEDELEGDGDQYGGGQYAGDQYNGASQYNGSQYGGGQRPDQQQVAQEEAAELYDDTPVLRAQTSSTPSSAGANRDASISALSVLPADVRSITSNDALQGGATGADQSYRADPASPYTDVSVSTGSDPVSASSGDNSLVGAVMSRKGGAQPPQETSGQGSDVPEGYITEIDRAISAMQLSGPPSDDPRRLSSLDTSFNTLTNEAAYSHEPTSGANGSANVSGSGASVPAGNAGNIGNTAPTGNMTPTVNTSQASMHSSGPRGLNMRTSRSFSSTHTSSPQVSNSPQVSSSQMSTSQMSNSQMSSQVSGSPTVGGPNPVNVLHWSPQEVEAYFAQKGLMEDSPKFVMHRITGMILLEMDRESLKEIDILSFGPRFEIDREIRGLRQLIGYDSLSSYVGGSNTNSPQSPLSPQSLTGPVMSPSMINSPLGTNSVSSFLPQPDNLSSMQQKHASYSSQTSNQRTPKMNVKPNGPGFASQPHLNAPYQPYHGLPQAAQSQVFAPSQQSHPNQHQHQGYPNQNPNQNPNQGYSNQGYQNQPYSNQGYSNQPEYQTVPLNKSNRHSTGSMVFNPSQSHLAYQTSNPSYSRSTLLPAREEPQQQQYQPQSQYQQQPPPQQYQPPQQQPQYPPSSPYQPIQHPQPSQKSFEEEITGSLNSTFSMRTAHPSAAAAAQAATGTKAHHRHSSSATSRYSMLGHQRTRTLDDWDSGMQPAMMEGAHHHVSSAQPQQEFNTGTLSNHTNLTGRQSPVKGASHARSVSRGSANANGNAASNGHANANGHARTVSSDSKKQRRTSMLSLLQGSPKKSSGSGESPKKRHSSSNQSGTSSSVNSASTQATNVSGAGGAGAGGAVAAGGAGGATNSTLKAMMRPGLMKQKTSAFQEGIQQTTATKAAQSAQQAGWLHKRGGNGLGVWSKRYFTLHGTRLSYFSSFKDDKERGLIDITGHRVLPIKDSDLVSLTAAGMGAGRFCFKLVPPGPGYKKGVAFTAPKVHYFAAESAEDMRQWQTALLTATIERDESAPVESTCKLPTMSLARAQELMAKRLQTKGDVGSLIN